LANKTWTVLNHLSQYSSEGTSAKDLLWTLKAYPELSRYTAGLQRWHHRFRREVGSVLTQLAKRYL